MAILTKDELKEIYQNLELGLVCYYNPEVKEIKTLPNSIDPYVDKKILEDQIKAVESDIDQFWILERMPLSEAFNVMKAFVEHLDDCKTKVYLQEALTKPKPFKQFGKVLESDAVVSSDWALFKEKRYCDWLLLQVGELASVN